MAKKLEMKKAHRYQDENLSPLIDKLRKFILQPAQRVVFGIIFEDTEGYSLYWYPSQPCYGEMRKYKSTHGKDATKTEGKPGDLFDPFPEGTPVAVGAPFRPYGSPSQAKDNLYRFMLSNDSPWHRVTQGMEPVKDKAGHIIGSIAHDTDVDSTLLVHFWHFMKCNMPILKIEVFDRLLELYGNEPQCVLFAVSVFSHARDKDSLMLVNADTYNLGAAFDLSRFLNGDPTDITGGTFKNRFDYDRRNIHDIFGKTGKRILTDLKGVLGVPNNTLDTTVKYKDLPPLFEYIKEAKEKDYA